MGTFTNRSYFVLCYFCFFAIAAANVIGCTVPVFQYALQNWQSAIYKVEINTTENPSAQEADIIAKLKSNPSAANYKIDVKVENDKTSQLTVYFPTGDIAWEKSLSQEAIEILLDSPVRKEMAKRLIRGETAVWILIESGDKAKDDSAENTLQQQLRRLEKEITLASNSIEDDPQDDPSMQVDRVDIKFSIIRIDRKDKNEEFFIASLLKSEEDLTSFDEPIAIPVFGRSIALYALVGKGITPVNIERACRFIAGPCSCVLKAENPGTDLLVSANWDDAVIDEPLIKEIELPELTSITSANYQNRDINSNIDTNSEDEYELVLLSDNVKEEMKKNDPKLIINVAFIFVAAIVLLGVVTIVTKTKKKK